MPRNPKESHARELEEVELDAPRVDESEMEDDERAMATLWADKRASFADEDEEETDVEDIDLNDLYAMEGPDS